MNRYALQFAFTKDNERRLAVRPDHRTYLSRMHAEGRLEMAGPWADDTGALLIYRAEDEAEMKAILAGDPYMKEDVAQVASLTEWVVLFPAQA